MKGKSFLIIGYFGYIDGQIDGQTLKTRNVYKLMKKMYNNVSYFDTQSLKKSYLAYLKLFFLIFFSKNVVLLPGKNNLSKLFSGLHKISAMMNKNIIIFAVGGWLSEFLAENKSIELRMRQVYHIFVESDSMKRRLINHNEILDSKISVFPNFRISTYVPKLSTNTDVFRIIFIARITIEKGCEKVFDFLHFYKENKSLFKKCIKVSFYGPIDKSYETSFFENIKIYNDIASYKGVVEAQEVFKIIGEHDLTVLPTNYPGEGFPGTIVDSYIAGVPVVVSNWKDLPELVVTGKTGYVFDLDKLPDFYSAIQSLVNDEDTLLMMKRNSLERSGLYSIQEAERILKTIL